MTSARPTSIALKRAYEDAGPADGYRALVDRLWPRGRSKESLRLDEWTKQVSPSDELRKTFHHDASLWPDFQRAYRKELAGAEQQEALHALLKAAQGQRLTLVYGARDTEHNNAEVLRQVLDEMARAG